MRSALIVVFSCLIICASGAAAGFVGGDDVSKGSRPGDVDQNGEDCGCDSRPASDLVAVVNGVRVTFKDIDQGIESQIEELEKHVIEMRNRELDLQINSILLESEAEKRGVDSTELVNLEIVAPVPRPTSEEARAFHDGNRSRIEGEFEDLAEDIIQYLWNQRQSERAGLFARELRARADIELHVEKATPPANEEERRRVLARVNGRPVTSADVEESLLPLISKVQERIHELRAAQLDLRINDLVLEQEARRRGVTARALLESEIDSRRRKVTEADARKFYEENRSRLDGEYESLKAQLVQYLENIEQRRVEAELALELRGKARIEISLAAPEPPVFAISVDDRPFLGAEDAPVTIVEFTDFQCPSCARTQPVLIDLVKEFGGRVKLVVRDFPLSQHEFAFKAAEAAEAARREGKYWEFIALLFENQSRLDSAALTEYAATLGLDGERFERALETGEFARKVRRDLAEGLKLGVDATPTIFINGRRVNEKTPESLRAAIRSALSETSR